jgi:hypothetical protein
MLRAMSPIAALEAPARDADEPSRTLARAALVFFRFPSPRFLAVHVLVLLGLRVAVGGFGIGDLLVLAAVAIYWPVQEWFLHVHALHFEPRRIFGWLVDPLAARMHRAHHREPWQLDYVFLPVKILFVLAPLSAVAWFLAMPSLPLALTGMTAIGAAALTYEWVHYLTHTHYRPRGRYYRWIWRTHRLHHFKNERYWHAFTGPMVDRLMGTAPDPSAVETSDTCRDLDGSGG